MILPTKGIETDRALLAVGADILSLLDEAKTVSRLWDEFRSRRDSRERSTPVSYDWFVLALDVLFALGTVDMDRGRLTVAAGIGAKRDAGRGNP
ncbi:MAG: ABC-three component system middle component 6 [Patescibacteria group bacterium]